MVSEDRSSPILLGPVCQNDAYIGLGEPFPFSLLFDTDKELPPTHRGLSLAGLPPRGSCAGTFLPRPFLEAAVSSWTPAAGQTLLGVSSDAGHMFLFLPQASQDTSFWVQK